MAQAGRARPPASTRITGCASCARIRSRPAFSTPAPKWESSCHATPGTAGRSGSSTCPSLPITDLTFRNNDLVASTQGRGFWILDDLSPVQQLTETATTAAMHLFTPREAIMASFGGGFGGGGGAGTTGANPPGGAQIFFSFAEAPDSLVTVEILDADGTAIRTFTTDPEAAGDEEYSSLPTPAAGLNRLAWDYRHNAIPGVDGYRNFGSLQGRVAAPGDYQVRLLHGEESRTAAFTVSPDPRWSATQAQYQTQERFVAEAQQVIRDLYGAVDELADVSDQVDAIVERTEEHPLADSIRASGEALTGRITEWEEELIQRRQQTFQDVINFRNKLDAQILALIGSVDGTEPPLTAGAGERWTDLQEEWAAHENTLGQLLQAVNAFNDFLTESGVQPITVLPRGRPVS